MRENKYYEKHRWRLSKGYPECEDHVLEELADTQWSPLFEQLMRNRLIMGALRYGKLHAKSKSRYDIIESIHKRLHNYVYSGNTEYLVDIANLCLIEFVENHSGINQHFYSIDDGEHVNIKSK